MTEQSINGIERREMEIGRATVWAETDVGKLTVHLGTLSTCLLIGYLLGRRRKVRKATG